MPRRVRLKAPPHSLLVRSLTGLWSRFLTSDAAALVGRSPKSVPLRAAPPVRRKLTYRLTERNPPPDARLPSPFEWLIRAAAQCRKCFDGISRPSKRWTRTPCRW
jgi:hypothetical protein